MDNETSKVMFALLRSTVYGDLFSDEEKRGVFSLSLAARPVLCYS